MTVELFLGYAESAVLEFGMPIKLLNAKDEAVYGGESKLACDCHKAAGSG